MSKESESAKTDALISGRKTPSLSIVQTGGNSRTRFGPKLFLAVSLGNIVEWYDFALYGYFANEISYTFFGDNSKDNLIFTYLIFGGAFAMRPIGGMLFGYIGDRFGRENALRLTIVTMGFSTVALGSVPGYNSLGLWSMVLLILVRLLQGLAVGGELVGSMLYAIECAPPEKKLFYGAVILSTANLGTLLGAIVAAIVHAAVNEDRVKAWVWRVPFWLSFVVAVIGWWIRRDMHGTTEFINSVKSDNPLIDAVKTEWKAILRITITVAVWSTGFYMTWVWSFEWVENLMKPSISGAYGLNVVGMSLLFWTTLASGWTLGRLKIPMNNSLLFSVLAVLVTQPILFYLMGSHKGQAWPYLIFQIVNAVTLGVFGSQMPIFMVNHVSNPSLRFTVLGVSYNLSMAIFGGTTPAIMTWLQGFGPVVPAVYYTTVCLAALVCILCSSPLVGRGDCTDCYEQLTDG